MSIDISKFTIFDLPEKYRFYDLELTSRTVMLVTGQEKQKILAAGSNFIVLKSGEAINKLHIISVTLNKQKTQDEFLKFSNEERKRIAEESLSRQAIVLEKKYT